MLVIPCIIDGLLQDQHFRYLAQLYAIDEIKKELFHKAIKTRKLPKRCQYFIGDLFPGSQLWVV